MLLQAIIPGNRELVMMMTVLSAQQMCLFSLFLAENLGFRDQDIMIVLVDGRINKALRINNFDALNIMNSRAE